MQGTETPSAPTPRPWNGGSARPAPCTSPKSGRGFPALPPRPEALAALGLLARSPLTPQMLPRSQETSRASSRSPCPSPGEPSRVGARTPGLITLSRLLGLSAPGAGAGPVSPTAAPGGRPRGRRVSHPPAPTASPTLRMQPRCPLQAALSPEAGSGPGQIKAPRAGGRAASPCPG